MKKAILTLLALCFTAGACMAQKAEPMKLSGDDAIAVLKAVGIEMSKYDLRQFQDKTYNGGSSATKPSVEVTNIVVNTNDINPNLAAKIQNKRVLKIDSRAIIGEITTMKMDRNYIYLLDARQVKKIFIINRSDGKLKNTIHRHGNSNSEYVSSSHFQVDRKTKDIYILDSQKEMVKQYNSSGKFINNINLPSYAYNFLLNGDGTMWIDKGNSTYGDESGKSLALIDMKREKVIGSYYDIPDYNEDILIQPLQTLFKVDSLVTYMPSMSRTAYSIIGEAITPKYHFDFGGKWPSERMLDEYRASGNPLPIWEKWKQGEYVVFMNYLESAKWVHLNFRFNGELLGYFFNKESRKGELYNLEGFGLPLYIENSSTFVFPKYEDEYTSLVFVTL